jgi:acyl carrier protein
MARVRQYLGINLIGPKRIAGKLAALHKPRVNCIIKSIEIAEEERFCRMQLSEIDAKIRSVLLSELRVDAASLAQSDSHTALIGRGIGLDSVEALTLVVALEEAFDIEIPDEDMNIHLFQNIDTLAQYVHKKLSSRQPQATPRRQ